MPGLKTASGFGFKNILLNIALASLLLISNIPGWNKVIYKTFDNVFNPFLISTRVFALNSSFFIKEVFNKRSVLDENIDLKRQILKYEEIKSENSSLKEQISKLEAQTKISGVGQRQYDMVKVVGIQNTFSSDPQVMFNLPNESYHVKENAPVYYELNTLFGFVSSVEGKTVKVNPYYSPNIDSKIPVQSLKYPSQKGFISNIENGIVKIKNLPKDYKIEEGDIWLTTNDVVEVPPSLIVGKVKVLRVNQQDGFQEVELELPFNLSSLSYLLIEK